MNVADIVDAALPTPHGNRQVLSCGELTVLWLASCPGTVRSSHVTGRRLAREHFRALEHATGWKITDKDLTDDRLADALGVVGTATANATTPVEVIELALGHHLIRAYALPAAVARFDTANISACHDAQDRNAVQSGRTLLHHDHSKDVHPERRQLVEVLGPSILWRCRWLSRR